jgi:ABC-type multidrug transport system fused ATPase/permease subunit
LLVLFIILLLQGKRADEILLVFSVIIAVMARVLPALSRCNYNITLIRQNRFLFDFVADSIFSLEREELGTADGNLTLENELEVKDLCFSYDGKKPVLKNFSLRLKANESLGISGKTGSGKTTLADLLLGLLRPDTGMILADGKNVFDDLQGWRQMIGYVSQNVYICNASIRENVAFGVPAEAIDDQRVREALQMAQIADWAENVPGGLDYLLHDSGTNLSGGQRQRIGIARALYTNPKLLILDEATSALDHETEAAFVEALENLNGKLTMIVIAHRLSTIEKCNQIIKIGS